MDIKQLIEAEIGCELTEKHLELYRKECLNEE
ncbi:hypothetical protein BN983_00831 [Halobacillus karajensis]|uniref:Uncharacterized protein n=1 Tax=Halobacillus karajensis TaxID=195088 RepID=A0A059NWB6_9BACI|nr:hypothetical protein BN983_00831 [Halobacillus karajensis]CDQ26100.1 hypothetical protein BN981_00311 [Halobacillus karajensis]